MSIVFFIGFFFKEKGGKNLYFIGYDQTFTVPNN